MTPRDKALLDVEIEFERNLAKSRDLSAFRRNATTWELLLLLAREPDGAAHGLHRVTEALATRHLGNSALLKFIRDRRDAGQIAFLEHEKRNTRTLRIDPALIAELRSLLAERNAAIARALARVEPPH